MWQLNPDFSSSSFCHIYPGLNMTTPSQDLAMIWYTYHYHHRNAIYMFWGSNTVRTDWLMIFSKIRANFPFCSSIPSAYQSSHATQRQTRLKFIGTGDIRLIWETAKQEWLIPDRILLGINCVPKNNLAIWLSVYNVWCILLHACTRNMLSPEYKCRHLCIHHIRVHFRNGYLRRIYAKLVSTHLIDTTPSLIKPLTWC